MMLDDRAWVCVQLLPSQLELLFMGQHNPLPVRSVSRSGNSRFLIVLAINPGLCDLCGPLITRTAHELGSHSPIASGGACVSVKEGK